LETIRKPQGKTINFPKEVVRRSGWIGGNVGKIEGEASAKQSNEIKLGKRSAPK